MLADPAPTASEMRLAAACDAACRFVACVMRREKKDNVYRSLDSTQHSTNCPRNNSFVSQEESGAENRPEGDFQGAIFRPRQRARERRRSSSMYARKYVSGEPLGAHAPAQNRIEAHATARLRPARIGWVRPFTASRTGNTQLRRGARRTEGRKTSVPVACHKGVARARPMWARGADAMATRGLTLEHA